MHSSSVVDLTTDGIWFACQQVLANDVNIGYEEITNTLVCQVLPPSL